MEVNKGYIQTEAGIIPSDWKIGTLGDKTIKIGSGITPTGGERVYKKEGRPFLRSQNVGWGKLLMEDIAFIDDETHAAFNSTEIKAKDVFLNITGASIGRSAVADERVVNGNVNQHVCIIRVKEDDLNPYFLNYFLLSRHGQRQIDSYQAGGNRQGLNFGQIKSFKIILPLTNVEQAAIANALSDVDALISRLEEIIAKKRNIKQGAMQQLLTGKKRLPGFSGEWEVKKLYSLVGIISSGIYGIEKPNDDTIPFLVATTAHINNDDTWNNKKMQVRYFTKNQIENYLPQNGDLIIVKSSGSAEKIQSGKIGYIDNRKSNKFLFSNFLMLLRPFNINSKFLFYYLTSFNVKRLLPNLVEASTYPNIKINDYLDLNIPSPVLQEQTAIAQILSDMDAEIEQLEQKLDKYSMIKQGMMQELLTGKTRLI
jgi:type I restriction enzyme S subunit